MSLNEAAGLVGDQARSLPSLRLKLPERLLRKSESSKEWSEIRERDPCNPRGVSSLGELSDPVMPGFDNCNPTLPAKILQCGRH